jgi:leucyl-tRNA synthetase
VLKEAIDILLRTLFPVAPHICHGLWTELGFAKVHGDIARAPWPQVDQAALVQDEVDLVLQVNGKLRGSIRIQAGAGNAEIEALARAAPEVARFGEGRPVKMVKVVPGRLVNVVC